MARRGRRSNRDARLHAVVSEHVDRLVAALSEEIRRSVADEVGRFLERGGGPATVARLLGKRRKKRILPCIAPGCSNPSKGPRFHYLCGDHRGASKKDYEAWRKAKKPSA
jgi:hypothetical protein